MSFLAIFYLAMSAIFILFGILIAGCFTFAAVLQHRAEDNTALRPPLRADAKMVNFLGIALGVVFVAVGSWLIYSR